MKPDNCSPRFPIFLTLFAAALMALQPAHPIAALATAQRLSPAGQLTELVIDNNRPSCSLGTVMENPVPPGFGWVNRLQPPTYPATLRSITIAFNRSGNLVNPDLLFRIVIYLDPENDGPANGQLPAASFIGRVRGLDPFLKFNLISPLRITEGSFVVGAIDIFGNARFPSLFDNGGTANPPGSQSFFSLDGGESWRVLRDNLGSGQCVPGSFLIRATVENDPADALAVTATISDPQAIEPWGVATTESGPDVIVANYVSDNLTIINKTNNTFTNLAIGDGTGGAADGPFGVVLRPDGARAYVTLFGSNTIPSREFPIDYATVGAGRVAVLTKQAGSGFVASAQINVSKGPGFPAILPDGSKLYVPCGGANLVDVINTTTNERTRSIPVGVEPVGCALSLDGAKLYVCNYGDSTLSVIDTKTDQVIKTITNLAPAAVGVTPQSHPERLAAPWTAIVSPVNANLYVTMRDPNALVHEPAPSAAVDHLLEIDTCNDTIIRTISDQASSGTPAGSAGASGIPAPMGALVRDAATGTTLGAGGGGGGPFALAACSTGLGIAFTNDGRGIMGVLDARIDQIVSDPPPASRPKLRGLACTPTGSGQLAYIALGQPDNAIQVVRIPNLPENLPNVPVITGVEIGDPLRILGNGFSNLDAQDFNNVSRVEVFAPGSLTCLTFTKAPKVKRRGQLIVQKGRLSDGRTFQEAVPVGTSALIRVVHRDQSMRVIRITRN